MMPQIMISAKIVNICFTLISSVTLVFNNCPLRESIITESTHVIITVEMAGPTMPKILINQIFRTKFNSIALPEYTINSVVLPLASNTIVGYAKRNISTIIYKTKITVAERYFASYKMTIKSLAPTIAPPAMSHVMV